MANPKAYIVDDRRNWDSATVVFAESAGQARSLALHTDACEDLDFTDISAKRAPKLDLAYRGVFEMDWRNDEDRLAMVRDANFYCDVGDLGRKELGCDSCVAKKYCASYEELAHEEKYDKWNRRSNDAEIH